MKIYIVLLLIINLTLGLIDKDCTDVSRTEEPLLVLSTLSGQLIAIDPLTAETRWTQEHNEPSVNTNGNINEHLSSIYLPDPVSGSLYKLQTDGLDGNELKKMPYTIPELVQNAPCKSSDGILYSGNKKDTWFMIDPASGKREWVMEFGSSPKKPSESIGFATSRAVYLGRTQYTIMMMDSLSRSGKSQPWNISFYDYNSLTMAPEISDKYEFIHVTSSTSGKIVTMNRKSGNFLWRKSEIESPIIAIFLLSREGFLSVPFTTVADDVLEKVIDYAQSDSRSDFQLYETVYIGESKGLLRDTMYAIPSYVDDNTPTIKKNSINLLEGPKIKAQVPRSIGSDKNRRSSKRNYILFGHYEVPDIESKSIESSKNNALTVRNANNLWYPARESESRIISAENIMQNRSDAKNSVKNDEMIESYEWKKNGLLKTSTLLFKNWFDHEENKILKLLMVILIGIVITMFWYFHTTVRELRQQSQNGSKTKISRSTDSNGSSNFGTDLFDDEIVEVGKISFNPRNILGKGCEGTFVFRGSFEKRDVAVKRLLPECFTLADREVSLLRESDTHENVVRYFCTEADRQFRYIAVELCSATLQDYVEGKNSAELRQLISIKEVLYQATNGLSHLHHLNIVHRDIKPQNVLISLPDNKNRVRALISDFGLCKKMNHGKASFSKRSGVTGTDGWIAPEMIKGQRTTVSVDIFSMGCVYYFVMSNGDHLFGDAIKRQSNILSYEFDMSKLKMHRKKPYENILAMELIEDMIQRDPSSRPSADAILKHPLFWREEKILAFLQDVSDRIEKLDPYTDPLKSLERNAKYIVRDDWSLHLDDDITMDLRKYRGYHGISVRDLLRALRNKKHHYHELSHETQRVLGSIPVEFVRYWISRFPHLLSHSYHAMEMCSTENIFKRYYSPNYVFTKPNYLSDYTCDNVELEEIFESSKSTYARSPKKENRQPSAYNNKMEKLVQNNTKNRRGAYNFNKNQPPTQRNEGNGFITRNDMLKVEDNRAKRNDENFKWILPEQQN